MSFIGFTIDGGISSQHICLSAPSVEGGSGSVAIIFVSRCLRARSCGRTDRFSNGKQGRVTEMGTAVLFRYNIHVIVIY